MHAKLGNPGAPNLLTPLPNVSLLQVLDCVAAVLMGANGFLPHLHAGLTSACMLRLLGQPTALLEFECFQVQQMAHVLRIRHVNAAKAVGSKLLEGKANPVDNISKLVLALLRICKPTPAATPSNADTPTARQHKQQAAIRLVLQEWMASMVQRRYGKETPENNERYLRSLFPYMPPQAVFSSYDKKGFDPLTQLSPWRPLMRQLDRACTLQCCQTVCAPTGRTG